MRPTRIPVLVAVVIGLLVAASLGVAGPASAATLTLDGVRVALPPGSSQVVTVKHTHGWHARITLWQHDATGWHRVARATDARTGYGGLVLGARRHQGTGTTPLGTYGLTSAFGRHPQAADWKLPYRQIQRGDFWVEDNASAYYNRYRNQSEGGFRWWLKSGQDTSERLSDYPTQYEYVVNTGFNADQVRHRGAGIFLHVNGRGATAGCVSAPRWFMRTMLASLDPARVPVIAIGR